MAFLVIHFPVLENGLASFPPQYKGQGKLGLAFWNRVSYSSDCPQTHHIARLTPDPPASTCCVRDTGVHPLLWDRVLLYIYSLHCPRQARLKLGGIVLLQPPEYWIKGVCQYIWLPKAIFFSFSVLKPRSRATKRTEKGTVFCSLGRSCFNCS